MSKKFIPVILVLTGASFFIAFKSQGKNDREDNPKVRYSKILRNVGVLLEEGHFSPKKIDDAFSKTVFDEFIKDLDGDKKVLLQSDIDELKKYQYKIDDEIHGAPLESFYAINEIYQKRQNESSQFYKDILSRPFDFNADETLVLDPDKTVFPDSDAARKEVWRKYLKYLVLDKYVSMQADRDKNKSKTDFKVKADSTLEREARESVRKQMERSFTTIRNRETNDYNFSTFVNAITGTMDPHTNYFPPIDLRSFNESMKGSFFGIGAVIKEEDGKIKIGALQTGMPAWKSGEIKENDELLKVAQGDQEPVDVTGYAVQDAVKLIRGAEKGSIVKLTLRKIDGSIKVVALKRDDIRLDETFAKSVIIKGEHKIGYIYLPEFYADFEKPGGARCAEDVKKEIEKLKAEKVEGIMLDLRGNGGGSLYDVVQMAGLFIEDGPICQVKGRDERAQVLRDKDKNVLYDGPFAVMVDETSASASEIFAAAIQDYKRGVIIGSTSTYGKGTVQRNIPLNPSSNNNPFASSKEEDLGTVKLTLQKFYRINGDATQQRGVVPDIILPDKLEFFKIREKDNPNALKYDEIEKTDYKTWTSTYSEQNIVSTANSEANTSSTFGKIRSNMEWLDKNADREYSLNITRYKADQKAVRDVYKQVDELYKLPKPLTVANLVADTMAINKTKEKIERNKDFVKKVSGDIYVDETVKVLNKMIVQTNIAKANGTEVAPAN
ncbi:carboxy terminal-processing peptidase [Ferruginibacter sp. HRS2-29]|uniref:carboxy terminal-processing peptidase n=1 Tax=Ferruginibacter sp. HRS2-29 TaxID=2487334 RepID=UPI0020CC2670|nr:carboxy terminal-processing peptidase [Ferruginibacter sp. HRS2-29]